MFNQVYKKVIIAALFFGLMFCGKHDDKKEDAETGKKPPTSQTQASSTKSETPRDPEVPPPAPPPAETTEAPGTIEPPSIAKPLAPAQLRDTLQPVRSSPPAIRNVPATQELPSSPAPVPDVLTGVDVIAEPPDLEIVITEETINDSDSRNIGLQTVRIEETYRTILRYVLEIAEPTFGRQITHTAMNELLTQPEITPDNQELLFQYFFALIEYFDSDQFLLDLPIETRMKLVFDLFSLHMPTFTNTLNARMVSGSKSDYAHLAALMPLSYNVLLYSRYQNPDDRRVTLESYDTEDPVNGQYRTYVLGRIDFSDPIKTQLTIEDQKYLSSVAKIWRAWFSSTMRPNVDFAITGFINDPDGTTKARGWANLVYDEFATHMQFVVMDLTAIFHNEGTTAFSQILDAENRPNPKANRRVEIQVFRFSLN